MKENNENARVGEEAKFVWFIMAIHHPNTSIFKAPYMDIINS